MTRAFNLTSVARTSVIWALLCVCASAQSPEETLAAAGKLYENNDYSRAIDVYKVIPESAPAEIRLRKHTGLALSYINLGRYAEAPDEMALARRIAEEIGTDAAEVSVLNVEGQYLSSVGEGDRGLGALQRAAELANSGEPRILANIYSNLATAHQQLEDWERFLYFLQKAFDLNPNPTPRDRRGHAMQLGIAYFELYERDAAEAQFKIGLELAKQAGGARDQSFATGELAFTYWMFDQDAPRALKLYTEASALADESKVNSLRATWRNNRGTIYRDIGQYEAALADFEDSIAILEAAGQTRGTFMARKNIGQTYRLMGNNREAVAHLESLIATRSADASLRHLWQAHMELASALESLGERSRAEAEYKKMLEVLEEHRNSAILDGFRTGTFAHALRLYDPYERYIRFLTSGDAPRIAEALEVVERARARGFLESLASVRAAVAAKLPPALLIEESRIVAGISGVQKRLRAADLPRADRERLLVELADYEGQRDKFRLAMRIEHPSLAEARYPEIAGAAAVQRALRPNETAIAFFLAEPGSFRWEISRDQLRLQHLPGRTAIEKQAGRVRQLLSAPTDMPGVRTETTALAAMLFGGLTPDADRSLVIVPHGVLHYIPFEALPLDGAPLVLRHSVSYMPSLNSLIQLRRAPRSAAPLRVLAVGNPSLSAAPAATTRLGDVENLALLGDLPYADRELYAIGRALPDRTQILSGRAARESQLRGETLKRFPVIHFATHGLVSDVHPTRSGLLFSPEDGEDGLLQMGEIYGMGLRADLVMLSACQTALGRDITGEGIVGLTRAFFYAGARSVVSALWNLNDRFAADFVGRFYQEIGAGASPEQALRRTKIAYVDHPQYSHPFYWSSLVITGDGAQPMVTDPIRAPLWPTWLAMAMTLAAIAVAAPRVLRSQKN